MLFGGLDRGLGVYLKQRGCFVFVFICFMFVCVLFGVVYYLFYLIVGVFGCCCFVYSFCLARLFSLTVNVLIGISKKRVSSSLKMSRGEWPSRSLYNDVKCCVKYNNVLSDFFYVLERVISKGCFVTHIIFYVRE